MTTRGILQNAAYIILLLLFLPVIIGGLLGSPAGISYVETESMSPALEPGDGFILIPTQLAGDYGIGDVITFDAENFPYDYVTHRIIAITPDGFMTQGDNNTFADQSGTYNEPYVKREQIAGKVLSAGDTLIVLPKLGKIITFINETIRKISIRLYSLLGIDMGNELLGQAVVSVGILSIVAIIIDVLSSIRSSSRKGNKREIKKNKTSPYTIYALFVIFLLFSTSISVLSMSQHNKIDFVASEGDTNTRAVHIGDVAERYLEVGNSGFIPAHVYIEEKSGIVSIDDQAFILNRGETRRVTYVINAPDEIGYYQDYVSIDIYMAIFPHSMTSSLRNINKYLPIIVFDILVFILSLPIFIYLKSAMNERQRNVERKQRAKSVL